MNVDVMRRVDYFLGVPLCFAGTIASRCIGFFTPRTKDAGPKNILFIELSEMGSAILADPAMQKLNRIVDSRLFFAIFRKNRASLQLLGTVPEENIYTIGGSIFSLSRHARILLLTRRKRIDAVIDLSCSPASPPSGFSRRKAPSGSTPHNEGCTGAVPTHRVAYNPHQHVEKLHRAGNA
jgi:hypothetical protein